MTRFYQMMNPHTRCLLATLILLSFGVSLMGQQVTVPAPLTAAEVIQRVVESNQARAKTLEAYSSLRTYHLECHCLSHKKADMVVRTTYQAPDQKEFTIVSESGSGTVRDRVFKKLIEAEQESMREENQRRSGITPENYTFQVSDYQKTDTDEFYVLDAQPRGKNKFLFRGHIWVDAKTFRIRRIEGVPAKSPSLWIKDSYITLQFAEVNEMWITVSLDAIATVRLLGRYTLTGVYVGARSPASIRQSL